MGVEVDAPLFHSSPEELMQSTAAKLDGRAKAKSIGGPASHSKRRSLRKSLSDRPLSGSVSTLSLTSLSISGSTSMESRLRDEFEDNQSEHEPMSVRRQSIIAQADEIIRGKKQVGMQLGETCPVCLLNDVDTVLSNCGHRVHAKCIKRWIQSGSKCPVCREVVTSVQEAFSGPPSALYHPLKKDVCDYTSEESYASSPDNQANEWGWFEGFEEFDDNVDHAEFIKNLQPTEDSDSGSPLMNRDMSTTFEVCRTFPPLRLEYDTPYAESKHEFLRKLPSQRHIAAKIQIRSFRIVENSAGSQYAEYLLEVQLDHRYLSRWRRFSELSKFVGTLGAHQFRRTLAAWAELEAASRWFNRLELPYLHRRCRMLEVFAHALLLESSSAHPLADLLAG